MQGSLQSSALPAELSKESWGPAQYLARHTLIQHFPIHSAARCLYSNALLQTDSPPTPHHLAQPFSPSDHAKPQAEDLHRLLGRHLLQLHSPQGQEQLTHALLLLPAIQFHSADRRPLVQHQTNGQPFPYSAAYSRELGGHA